MAFWDLTPLPRGNVRIRLAICSFVQPPGEGGDKVMHHFSLNADNIRDIKRLQNRLSGPKDLAVEF